MSLTGLGLCLFLLSHVIGNIQILLSASKFNDYAHSLASFGALLYVAEAGLLGILVLHVLTAIKLTCDNRAARPMRYKEFNSTGRSKRWWGSSNMIVTGTAVLAFIIYHLIQFKFGPVYETTQNGVAVRDLAKLVNDEFHEIEEVIIYVIAMLLIGFHLWHGFRSLFETLGLSNSKWSGLLRSISRGYVIVVIGGFILIPLWIYLGGQ